MTAALFQSSARAAGSPVGSQRARRKGATLASVWHVPLCRRRVRMPIDRRANPQGRGREAGRIALELSWGDGRIQGISGRALRRHDHASAWKRVTIAGASPPSWRLHPRMGRRMMLECVAHTTRSCPARWFPDTRRACRARRCKPVVSTAVRGGGLGRRQGAASTAMVHQDRLARAPTDRASEPGPQGALASAPG